MQSPETCPECGADWSDGQTCQDRFHQMLFWEAERPEIGVVHHLMVLCHHLQHPSLYSEDGLRYSRKLLDDFVANGVTPEEARRRNREAVSSENRHWKVTARPDSVGAYERPIHWTMTSADVVARGIDNYVHSVGEWAQSVYDALRAADEADARS
ncbi:MAG: DUF5946 family protein [Chloroflexota bacterium]|nr:MAG: hypothetical protein DIU68_20330 [Chloroflexota bacterium]